MNPRSSLAEVRNPILKLDSCKKLIDLPLESKLALREVLLELSKEASEKAEHLWQKSKAPMAVYWKAVSVYAKHIANLLGKTTTTSRNLFEELC